MSSDDEVKSDKPECITIESIREIAESAAQQTGFIYEETSGLYYHSESGYYYDAESRLYYDGNTGTYYSYNQDTESYELHSQIPVSNLVDPSEHVTESDSENIPYQKSILEGGSEDVENPEDSYPPCMRMIVQETNLPNLQVGCLFIVTYLGGTIGREGDHSVLIPDINVSKHHAKLRYDEVKGLYEIIDLGSRNGTLLDGVRLSVAKQESEPTEIAHGSILRLGTTNLLCHVHKGRETCDSCEPGLVQVQTVAPDYNAKSYRSELKRLKQKFAVEQVTPIAAGYQDRAHLRRKNVGTTCQYEKTQQSSLNEPIPQNNPGFKMLSKMGWAQGKSLGKSGGGITEPVSLSYVTNQQGLGSSAEPSKPEIDSKLVKKQAIWKKTQQRFDKVS